MRLTLMKRTGLLASILLAVALCMTAFLSSNTAFALEEPEYTPGEDYYIDDIEAFQSQDIDHEEAAENVASTQYYMTCSFYIDWISPDMTIYEGEDAYIGCGATGLNDISYSWEVSTDHGQSFTDADLIGNEHTISGLTANGEEAQQYLYRCTITNGDNTSTLEADVYVTVKPNPNPDFPAGNTPAQTGDLTTMTTVSLLSAAGICGLLLALASRRYVRKETSEPEE